MWKPWRSSQRESGTTNATVLLQRAVRALIDDDDHAAEEALSEWVRQDSRLTEPYRALGRLYRKRGEVGRAVRLHQNLLLRKDLGSREREAALAELAKDFEVGGYRKRAIACHEELIAAGGRREDSLGALVELFCQESEYALARAMHRRLEKARRTRDPRGEARLLVAEAKACYETGESDRARKLLKKALLRDASQTEARLLLGDLEIERGRHRAAVASWRPVAEGGGEFAAQAWSRLAAGLAGRGRAFERILQARLESEPGDREARRQRAVALLANGDVEQALIEWRALLAANPRDWATRSEMGRVLLSEQRSDEALAEFADLLGALESLGPGEELE